MVISTCMHGLQILHKLGGTIFIIWPSQSHLTSHMYSPCHYQILNYFFNRPDVFPVKKHVFPVKLEQNQCIVMYGATVNVAS